MGHARREGGAVHRATLATPLGPIELSSDGDGITGLRFADSRAPTECPPDACLAEARAQLERYWAGEPIAFDVPVRLRGTSFQTRVWHALLEVPYGQTITYAELARRIDAPRAVRAVGRANGTNPISIIVPCHRVVGSNGSLTGYGGGLERKKRLLELESGSQAIRSSTAPS